MTNDGPDVTEVSCINTECLVKAALSITQTLSPFPQVLGVTVPSRKFDHIRDFLHSRRGCRFSHSL